MAQLLTSDGTFVLTSTKKCCSLLEMGQKISETLSEPNIRILCVKL